MRQSTVKETRKRYVQQERRLANETVNRKGDKQMSYATGKETFI